MRRRIDEPAQRLELWSGTDDDHDAVVRYLRMGKRRHQVPTVPDPDYVEPRPLPQSCLPNRQAGQLGVAGRELGDLQAL